MARGSWVKIHMLPRSIPRAGTHLDGARLRLKCDGTRAETRFCLSAKRTSPVKSAGT